MRTGHNIKFVVSSVYTTFVLVYLLYFTLVIGYHEINKIVIGTRE